MATADERASALASANESRFVLLLRNTFFNTLRAFSSSAVTVLIPIFLVVVLEPRRYAVWALIFSLGSFVAYFDLGLPTTAQALVGRAVSVKKMRDARNTVASGLAIILLVSGICVLASVLAALGFNLIFPSVPKSLNGEGQWGLILIVIGQASILTGNVVSSYFSGQQRSHVAALILSPGRILSLVCAVVAAAATRDLVTIALGYAAPLFVATGILVLRFRVEAKRNAPEPATNSHAVGWRGLLRYSGPLMVWSICMLVTTGLDLIIVAHVDYQAVVSYSIAAIVVSAVAGLQSAATGPLLPELARAHTLLGPARVSRLAERFNLVNGTLLFGVTAVLLVAGPLFLPILAHESSSMSLSKSWLILAVLLVGNAFHLAGTPLSLTFIATQTHSKVIVPPVVEAALNLVLSLVLGIALGAIGVAIGTLLASAVGILLGYFWSVRVSGVLETASIRLLWEGVLRPFACVIPALIGAIWVVGSGHEVTSGNIFGLLAGAICSMSLLWFAGLPAKVRVQIGSRLRRHR